MGLNYYLASEEFKNKDSELYNTYIEKSLEDDDNKHERLELDKFGFIIRPTEYSWDAPTENEIEISYIHYAAIAHEKKVRILNKMKSRNGSSAELPLNTVKLDKARDTLTRIINNNHTWSLLLGILFNYHIQERTVQISTHIMCGLKEDQATLIIQMHRDFLKRIYLRNDKTSRLITIQTLLELLTDNSNFAIAFRADVDKLAGSISRLNAAYEVLCDCEYPKVSEVTIADIVTTISEVFSDFIKLKRKVSSTTKPVEDVSSDADQQEDKDTPLTSPVIEYDIVLPEPEELTDTMEDADLMIDADDDEYLEEIEIDVFPESQEEDQPETQTAVSAHVTVQPATDAITATIADTQHADEPTDTDSDQGNNDNTNQSESNLTGFFDCL